MTQEKKLIRQIEYGDRKALGELIEMYYSDIFKYCRWHTSGQVFAEDATQETFLKMVRYMDSRPFKGNFRAFLYQIAKNTCIDLSRKRYRDDVSLESMESEPNYLESGFRQAEEDEWLYQIMKNLEPDLKEMILLRFGQNLTLRETAEVMGLPMRTVQSKLRTVLKKMKIELKQEMKKGKGGF